MAATPGYPWRTTLTGPDGDVLHAFEIQTGVHAGDPIVCVTWDSGVWIEYTKHSSGEWRAVRSNHADFHVDPIAFVANAGVAPALLARAIDAVMAEESK